MNKEYVYLNEDEIKENGFYETSHWASGHEPGQRVRHQKYKPYLQGEEMIFAERSTSTNVLNKGTVVGVTPTGYIVVDRVEHVEVKNYSFNKLTERFDLVIDLKTRSVIMYPGGPYYGNRLVHEE